MKITSVKVFSYSLPLVKPLAVKDVQTKFRNGILIKLVLDNEHYGWGEIAPLEGYSKESISDVLSQISIFRRFLPQDIHINTESSLVIDIGTITEKYRYFPSVKFGLESALLSAISHQTGKPIPELMGRSRTGQLSVNALLDGDIDTILLNANSRYEQGFRSFKLKLGRKEICDDTFIVNKLHESLPEDTSFRLDSNRSWNVEQFTEFLRNTRMERVEYYEEPLIDFNPEVYGTIHQAIPYNLALDETISVTSSDEYLSLPFVKAVVIKPTMLGLIDSIKIAQRAQEANIKTVFSSTFESSVGISIIAQCASTFGTPGSAVGLDTLDRFEFDLRMPPITIIDGLIDIDALTGSKSSVNLQMLKEASND